MERLHYSRGLLDGFHSFYRMLANRPLQKAVSEFDKISPLLILSLMDFVSCLPEWVPPTFFYVYPSAFPGNLVLIACFWINFFFFFSLQDQDPLHDYSGKVFVRNFSFPAFLKEEHFLLFFPCIKGKSMLSSGKGGGFIWDSDLTLAAEGNGVLLGSEGRDHMNTEWF